MRESEQLTLIILVNVLSFIIFSFIIELLL
jgi:hypothetical protein